MKNKKTFCVINKDTLDAQEPVSVGNDYYSSNKPIQYRWHNEVFEVNLNGKWQAAFADDFDFPEFNEPTGGEWIVSEDNESTENLLVMQAQGQVICEIDPTPEAMANARLIAASRDLLEACKLALETTERSYDSDYNTISALKEAIEKATKK
jgi:hypothetical protein